MEAFDELHDPPIDVAPVRKPLPLEAITELEVIADRRSKPQGSDLISLLCHSEVNGERLDDESIVQETLLILIGGDETTRHVITGGQLALFEHPDQWKIMRSEPGAHQTGVEEMLRWISPIKNMCCTVTHDVEFMGQQLSAGQKCMLLYESANRDETKFTDPHRFDIERSPNRHLAFGIGQHFCLGAHVARLELQVIFRHLARRLEKMELAGPVERLRSVLVGGVKHIPIRYRLAA